MSEDKSEGYERVSLNRQQIDSIKIYATNGADFSERISLALAVRLLAGEHAAQERKAVLSEISRLESGAGGSTKAESQFRHAPLFPLWHKHFSTDRHLIRNIGDRWGIKNGNGNRNLDKLLADIAGKYGDQPEEWQRYLSHRFVIDAIHDRIKDGRLTGDWIIYGKNSEMNYYLDLATHEEGKNPEELLKKIRLGCDVEFPFLFL